MVRLKILVVFFFVGSIDKTFGAVPLTNEERIPVRTSWDNEYAAWREKPGVKVVLAELRASIKREAYIKSRRNGKMIRHLLRTDPGSTILIFAGRVIADRRYLTKEKNRKHGLFIVSCLEKGLIPASQGAIYSFIGNSTGVCVNQEGPCAVIAKRGGYEAQGFMVENPYFHDPDFWDAVRGSILKAAADRPFESRESRIFWRGHVTNSYIANESQNPYATEPCEDEHGNFARLQALALSVDYPHEVNVKCWQLKKCLKIRDDSIQKCPGLDYDPTMTAIRKDPQLATQEGHVPKENFSNYKFILNLPGSTQGSYSRNLNHLWALGSIILLWKNSHKEWYYPALKHMDTHLDVDYKSLLPLIHTLSPQAMKILRDGAHRIDQTFLCPTCLAFYLRAVYEHLTDHFFPARELNDPCIARHLFRNHLNCSNLELYYFLPSSRHLSHFDLIHNPRHHDDGHTSKIGHEQSRRLSTQAPVRPLGPPGSCAGLIELASQACQRKLDSSDNNDQSSSGTMSTWMDVVGGGQP